MTAIDLLKQVYLKYHCGEDRPENFDIMSKVSDYLCDQLGDDEMEKWMEKGTLTEEELRAGLHAGNSLRVMAF